MNTLMKFMTMFAVMFMLGFTSPVMAGEGDDALYGLTKVQKAELLAVAAQKKVENAVGPTNNVTPDDVLKYANIGAGIGKALASTARELGVEVNKFADTSVGKLAVFLVVWHMFGATVIHVLGGVSFAVFGTAVWIYFFRQYGQLPIESTRTTKDDKDKEVTTVSYDTSQRGHDARNGVFGWRLASFVVIMGVSSIMVFSF